jgi:hypothetical protein
LIRNGPNEINITDVTGGNDPTQTLYGPGEEISIDGISTTGDIDITITYDKIGGLSGHTDTGTIRN